MKPKRALHVVPDCQPQTQPKLGYGLSGGRKIERLPHSPLAHEANIIARCQSARSVGGRAAEPWDYEHSRKWLDAATRPSRYHVTVPPSREPTAPRRPPAAPIPHVVPADESIAGTHFNTQPGAPGKESA